MTRRTSGDLVRVVEAGYRWVEGGRDWLRGIARAAEPFGVGTGVAAYELDLREVPKVEQFAGCNLDAEFEQTIRAFTSAFDQATAQAVYAPTEFVGNSRYRIRRLAAARNLDADVLTGGHDVNAWALVAGDPRTFAVALTFPANEERLDPDRAFPRARALGLAAAHLGAALRLRRLAAPLSKEDDVTKAVISPDGRVLHAEGDARDGDTRKSLVEAVAQQERARGRMRRVSSEEALALWSVLVDGRWSIVDFVDHDGKRMLLARKNQVKGADVVALDDQERDVFWLTTLGHSQKYIAYELGLSFGAVNRRLSSALRKVRVKSRRELLRKLGVD